MRFQSGGELEAIAERLAEADFEKADCRWDPTGAVFLLETSRPSTKDLKGAGLFRKPGLEWVKCRLTIRRVRALSIWEEYDVKPPLGRLLQLEKTSPSFRIRLFSAHGLRVDLTVDRLEGDLEDF